VGTLQFDVVAFRLKDEYKADCIYEPTDVFTARWVDADDPRELEAFRKKVREHLALDGGETLTYLARSRANLQLVQERHPEITFRSTREH